MYALFDGSHSEPTPYISIVTSLNSLSSLTVNVMLLSTAAKDEDTVMHAVRTPAEMHFISFIAHISFAVFFIFFEEKT